VTVKVCIELALTARRAIMATFPEFFDSSARRATEPPPRTADGSPHYGAWADFLGSGGGEPVQPVPAERRTPAVRAALGRGSTQRPTYDVDRIASYVPWHHDPDRWGIYFWDGSLYSYARELSEQAQTDIASALDFAALTVLEHEYIHFEVEVAATELEAVADAPLYDAYLAQRFARQTQLGGPLEEALATAAEVAAAERLGNVWSALTSALTSSKSLQLSGYKEWSRVFGRRENRIGRAVLGQVLCGEAATWRSAPLRMRSSARERADVPVYWRALDASPMPAVFVPKTHAPVTIADLERWLRLSGFQLDPGAAKGDHVGIMVPSDGSPKKIAEYDSGGRRRSEFYVAQAHRVARALGVGTARDLYALIRSKGLLDPKAVLEVRSRIAY
jgi:hypothetical protein